MELKDKKIYWCSFTYDCGVQLNWLYQYKQNDDGELTKNYYSLSVDEIGTSFEEIFYSGRIFDIEDQNDLVIREATQEECLLFCSQLIKHGYEYNFETNEFK